MVLWIGRGVRRGTRNVVEVRVGEGTGTINDVVRMLGDDGDSDGDGFADGSAHGRHIVLVRGLVV